MTNTINVIIGEMGSGKTTILSHLQPWATVGSLDERNTDGIIIEEMNGHKYLVFQNGADIYEITHSWKWEKDHHSLKSYFKKNGEELNPNGNQSSFKELVELEMGIDQSFLQPLASRLNEPVRVVICGDHVTSSLTGKHGYGCTPVVAGYLRADLLGATNRWQPQSYHQILNFLMKESD